MSLCDGCVTNFLPRGIDIAKGSWHSSVMERMTTNSPSAADAAERKVAMTSTNSITITQAEAECRAFVAEFPTLNSRRAIVLAEAGTISWFKIYEIFQASLAKGLAEVA